MLLHRISSDHISLFLTKARADVTARALQLTQKARTRVVMADRIEPDRSRSIGWVVSYAPQGRGPWQFI